MAHSDTPSELQSHLGYWLRTVSNAVSQSFAQKVEASGVTVAEWVVLRVLYDQDGIAQSELARRMGMTKGAISKLTDRLVGKGLVTRKSDPHDKRAYMLVLQRAGRQLVPRLAQLADENDAAFFGALTREQRRQLETALRKIAADRALINIPTT